jgi:uncharacterized protein (DUF1778 family)
MSLPDVTYDRMGIAGCHDTIWQTWHSEFERRRQNMATTETRSEKLDLRLTPSAKRVLQTAARAAGLSVSEFVLESALARAEETLPNRQHFGLSAGQWTAFLAALDAPPQAAPRLVRLLREPSVFERGRGNESSH